MTPKSAQTYVARVTQLCRKWLPSDPRTRAVVAMFVVGVGIVAASIIAPFNSPEHPSPKAPPPLKETGTIKLGRADNPARVVPSSHGAVWITDEHRALIYRLSESGTTRQYPLQGVEDPQDTISGAVTAIASDRSGNAWVLASHTFTESLLIGVTPGGAELARFRVPSSDSLAIDRKGYAWAQHQMGVDDGIALTSVSLRSGAMKEYVAFPDTKMFGARVKTDARGDALLLGEVNLGARQSTHVMARLTREGVVNRPVRWPESLDLSLAADFVTNRDGDVWTGYAGGLAKIDSNGTVTAYPLFPNILISFLAAEPDGRIVFNFKIGPQFDNGGPFSRLRSPVYIGELDPEHLTRLPTLQLEPALRNRIGWFGLGRRHDAVITDAEAHKVFMVPLTVPRPATPPPPAFLTTVRQIIDQHQAAMTKLRNDLLRHRKDPHSSARATAKTIARTRTRLLAALSKSATVPDPLITRLIKRTAADGQYTVRSLAAMVKFPRKPTYGTEFYRDFLEAYHFVAAQFSADLYETAEVLGLPPIAYDGHKTWQPARL